MAKKRQKRVLFLGIISLVFLYPVIYMLICSVWEGKNAGVSMMGYYRVLLESPGYLVKFWRSLGMCLLIAGGQTILACMAGTAFAKYRFIGKKFWLAMMALFMILPVQYTNSGFKQRRCGGSDGKAGIFEQLEIAYYPGDFFPVWNSVADLYFSVYSG